MVSCYVPSRVSTADRKFVLGEMAINQSFTVWALDSGKGAVCHFSFMNWFDELNCKIDNNWKLQNQSPEIC